MAGIPPTHTISMLAGDTLKFAFQIKEYDLDVPEDPAAPKDLTGWTALAQVRQTPTSAEVITTWEIDPLDESGIVRMKLSSAQTQSFATLKEVVSDVQLTDPDGEQETFLKIVIHASQDVTRE